MSNVKEVPKVITPDPITETDEKEEDQVSPGSADPPAYDEAVHYALEHSEVIEEPVSEELTNNA